MDLRRLSIIAFEPVELGQCGDLARELEERLELSPVLAATLPVPASAHDPKRNQYRSRGLLSSLVSWRSGAGETGLVLGVTDRDIFIPRLNFIFGEADRQQGAALVSLARLGQGEVDARLAGERLLKESIHEVGHLLGLDHCPKDWCIMHYSNSIEDTDLKGPGFCPACQDSKI